MNLKTRILLVALILLVLAVGFVQAGEEAPMNNADVIKLTRLAMGDQVIITKIKTAKSVRFDTATDDLIKLRESGVSGPVITAMLERSAPAVVTGTTATKGSGASMIVLVSKEGTFEIKPMQSLGKVKTVSAPFRGVWGYLDFPAEATATRVRDRFPTLILNANADPHRGIWLVKLSPWPNGVLALELESSSVSREFFSNEPDENCTVPYTATEEKPGIWRLTPKGELKPGDYGFFRWAAYNDVYGSIGVLVGFRIDK